MTRDVKVQPDKVKEIVDNHLVGHKVAEDIAISEEDKEMCIRDRVIYLSND